MRWRRAGLVALGLLVSSCQLAQAPTNLPVVGGAVVIAGPRGYCVDSGASRDGPQGAFVLLGSCASIAGSQWLNAPPPLRAVLTAAVSAGAGGATIAGNARTLGAFFRSYAGRRALSRSGDPRSVRVIGEEYSDGVFILHARDTSAFPGHSVSPDYWRALFDLNGHIVTLSVIGVPQAPFTDAAALGVLHQFVAAVRRASPRVAPAMVAPAAAQAPIRSASAPSGSSRLTPRLSPRPVLPLRAVSNGSARAPAVSPRPPPRPGRSRATAASGLAPQRSPLPPPARRG